MRIRTILAAAAAPAALAAVLLGTAGQASASVLPKVTEVTTQAQLDALTAKGPVAGSIDIPANADTGIKLGYAEIKGNLFVEGQLTMWGDTVDGSVFVSGPGSFLGWTNQANHVKGSLTVAGSSGIYQGGPGTMSFGNWTQYPGAAQATAQSQVDGSLFFIGNGGGLYSGYPMHVNGKFVYVSNTNPVLDRGGLTVDGQQFVS
jgi:hypothetical protein